MPEMAVPSFRINYHRLWRQLVSLITDGRYSGTNFGVSVGHVAPESIKGGGILYLQTGDLLHMRFRAGRIDLLDREAFVRGEIARHVNLKFAPEIRFRIDERFAEAERIEKILRTPEVLRDLEKTESDKTDPNNKTDESE